MGMLLNFEIHFPHIMLQLPMLNMTIIFLLADFPPPSTSTETISVGAIVGIVIGSLLVVLLIIGVLWWKCCPRRKTTLEQGNFDDSNIILSSKCSCHLAYINISMDNHIHASILSNQDGYSCIFCIVGL